MNAKQIPEADTHNQAVTANATIQQPSIGDKIAERVIVSLGASIVFGFIGTCVAGPPGAVIGAKLGACLGLGGGAGDVGGSGMA